VVRSFRFIAVRLGAVLAPLLLASSLFLSGCDGPTRAAAPPPAGMALIPGGSFRMGTESSFPYEGPVHEVSVSPFYLDTHEVTNAQFAAFVKATGYRTVAERLGWSGVFDPKLEGSFKWKPVDGVDWRWPTGPGSSITGKEDYPVVQVCYEDAQGYARWAGKRLPTEAEWEFAARGGLDGKRYPWGDELEPGGRYMANYWQGIFPDRDLGKDGYKGIAPVGQFQPNGYGLYDMAANVWEWVQDRFSPTYYRESAPQNPAGPTTGDEYVIRGGSFLCAENWCQGYRAGARNKNTADSATEHMGFRCARDIGK
jgi:formylglycine-generating enzyme